MADKRILRAHCVGENALKGFPSPVVISVSRRGGKCDSLTPFLIKADSIFCWLYSVVSSISAKIGLSSFLTSSAMASRRLSTEKKLVHFHSQIYIFRKKPCNALCAFEIGFVGRLVCSSEVSDGGAAQAELSSLRPRFEAPRQPFEGRMPSFAAAIPFCSAISKMPL